MTSSGDRIAILLALLSILTLMLGLLGMAALFGVAVIATLLLPLWFGWRQAGRPRRMRALVTAFAVVLGGCTLAIFALDDPQAAQPETWWGYPPATAVFVYVVWPLGLLPAVLYGLFYPTDVLADEDLSRFLKRYSKGSASDRHGA